MSWSPGPHRPSWESAIRTLSLRASPLAVLAAALGGCAVELSTPTWPARVVERVEVSAAATIVQPGAVVPVHATVVGPVAVSQAVTWVASPNSFGDQWAFVTDGRLHVPRFVSRSVTRIQVRATSLVDSNVSGTAELEIPALALGLTPLAATAVVGEPVQFRAQLDGMARDTALTWRTSGGTIDASGRFLAVTPPATSPVTVSVEVPGEGLVRTAEVVIQLPPPRLTAITGGLDPGAALTLHGEGFVPGSWATEPPPADRVATVVAFQDDVGGVHEEATACASTTECTAAVPPGFQAGTVQVRLAGGGYQPVASAPLAHAVTPGLRLRADRNRLAAGEATTLRTVVLGVASSLPVVFTVDAGTVSDARYTAPAIPPPSGQVHLRACLGATGPCAGQTLSVVPFRVEPAVPLVPVGGTLALAAVGGAGPVTFTLASGGGAVTPDGRYTAGTGLGDGGPAWLLASDGTRTIPVEVGVTGTGPGMLLRIDDVVGTPPAALADGVPWGEVTRGLTTDGARLYVAAEPRSAAGARRWIDVYDLADPRQPAWLGAVAAGGTLRSALPEDGMVVAAGRLQSLSRQLGHEVLETFDLSGPLPVPVARTTWPEVPTPSTWTGAYVVDTLDAEASYLLTPLDQSTGAFTVAIRRHDAGPDAPPLLRTVEVPPTWLLAPPYTLRARLTAGHGRAFAKSEGGEVAAWDLSTEPPTLLWSQWIGSGWRDWFQLEWPYLRNSWNGCMDARADVPGYVPCGPVATVTDGQRGVGGAGLLDLTDLLNPIVLSTSTGYGGTAGGTGGALLGDLFWGADGGLSLFDLSPGGLLGARAAPLVGADFYAVRGLRAGDGLLYAGGTEQGTWRGLLAVLDPAGGAGALAWSTTRDRQIQGLDVADGLAVLALESGGLEVLSLADPRAPVTLATVPMTATGALLGGPLAVSWFAYRITVVDLASAAAPVVVGDLDLGSPIRSARWLAPGRLLVGLGDLGGLAVVDVSATAPPALVSRALPGVPLDVAAVDGAVAWCTGPDGLRAVDLSDPAAPALLAFVPEPAGVRSPAWLEGEVLWVTWGGDDPLGLLGYDVRLPRWPRQVSGLGLPGVAAAVEQAGLETFALSPGGPLRALDLSAARNVVTTGTPAPSPAPGVSP